VTSIDIDKSELGEELSNQRQYVIRHILALCTSNKQSGLLETDLVGVFVGEISKVVQCLTKNTQRDAEFARLLTLGHMHVAKKELSDGQRLLILTENLVGLRLACDTGFLDLLHCPDVFRKISAKRDIHRGIIDGNDIRYKFWRAKCQSH
jgi:hypothetical protein